MLKPVKALLDIIIITVLLLGGGLAFRDQPALAADGGEPTLPPMELPKKGNPRLDSTLNRLVSEAPRKVALLAQNNTETVSAEVRVIVE